MHVSRWTALCLCALCGPVCAQSEWDDGFEDARTPPERGFFIGAALASSGLVVKTPFGTSTPNPFGYRVFASYSFTQFVEVQAQLQSFGHQEEQIPFAGALELKPNARGLALIGHIPSSRFVRFNGRLGLANTKTSVRFQPLGLMSDGSIGLLPATQDLASSRSLQWGIGAEWLINQRWLLTANYDSTRFSHTFFRDDPLDMDVRVQMISFGASMFVL